MAPPPSRAGERLSIAQAEGTLSRGVRPQGASQSRNPVPSAHYYTHEFNNTLPKLSRVNIPYPQRKQRNRMAKGNVCPPRPCLVLALESRKGTPALHPGTGTNPAACVRAKHTRTPQIPSQHTDTHREFNTKLHRTWEHKDLTGILNEPSRPQYASYPHSLKPGITIAESQ
jgi:hypothetical protein